MLHQHPFITQNQGSSILPPQMLSLKEKTKDDNMWGRLCLDALENIARLQYFDNLKFINNYKLVNGEFIASEYLKQEYSSPLAELTEELDLPTFVKNYDIISQPINQMIGEIDTYPDVFQVVGKGEWIDNERERIKTDLLKDYLVNKIENEINQKLIKQGVNPFEEDFETEEEMQQYQQQLQEQKQAIMNPMEVQKYVSRTWRHNAEIWGSYELDDQKERFSLFDLRRNEFRDLLITGRRFRHIYLDSNGQLKVESWNPVYTFYHKSPETKFVQDGNHAGRLLLLSLSDIIDRFGSRMTNEQLEDLTRTHVSQYKESTGILNKTMDGKPINYLSPTGVAYGTPVPTLDNNINKFFPQVKDYPSGNYIITPELLDQITGNSALTPNSLNTLYVCVEAYWMSQERLGRLHWINPETQEEEIILIDENFIVPKYIKELKKEFINEEENTLNTVTWTWRNVVYEGVKINNFSAQGQMIEPIYLGMKAHKIQFKGEVFVYNPKLPVAGQVANNRNVKSAGAVDMIKSEQFLYNVLMNQVAYHLEREILPFVLMDVNLLPNDKDWGGKKNLEKWIETAKKFGVVPADTSPSNTQGANAGGQLPKVIDLDLSQRIINRIDVATKVKYLALEKLGISPQRLGDVKASETATGINQAIAKSYTQTSSWFTEFFSCERDILKMQLDAAQMLQSKNSEITASVTHSDMSNAFIKFNNNDFSLQDLHIEVSNSQEELRKIDLARKLAMDNTLQAKTSDRLLMTSSHSMAEIVEKIKMSEQELIDEKNKEYALQQQQIDANKEIQEKSLQQANEHFYAKLENDLQQAYISAFGYSNETGQDLNENKVPDMLEFAKFNASLQELQSKGKLDNQKLQMEQVKMQQAQDLNKDKLRLQEEKMVNDQKIQLLKIKQAKIAGDKSK